MSTDISASLSDTANPAPHWPDPASTPAFVNGQYVPLGEAKISVLDRGFLFADGVYEVVPIYNGQLFRWPAHRQRLCRSLRGLSFAPESIDLEQIDEAAARLARECGARHASLYLQISRGAGAQRNHDIPTQTSPTVVMWPMALAPSDPRPEGLRLKVLPDIRWQWCHLKTVALLGNVLLRHQARQSGYDDAFLLRSGRVVEATAANYFLIDNDTLYIPDSNDEMLPGITRQVITDLARRIGLEWTLSPPLLLSRVLTADEVWLCSSTKLMLPVVAIDGCALADHNHSGVGLRLLESFIGMIESYHPDQDQG